MLFQPRQTNVLEPTIFHEPWWLDAVTGGRWTAVEVSHGGSAVGRLPYILRTVLGVRLGDMPPLTHFLGPAIDDGNGKPNTRLLRHIDITRELIGKLPPMQQFYAKCHKGVSEVIGFQAAKFHAAVQFTHEIAPQPIESVWNDMRDKSRNGIRLAADICTIDTALEPAAFLAFYAANLEARSRTNYLDMTALLRVLTACLDSNRGRILAARDKGGVLLAAVVVIWDTTTCYYYNATRKLDAHRGAVALLQWEAISDAMSRGLHFDFDGAPNEGSFRMATNFSANVTPRYIVTRQSLPVRLYRALKSAFVQPDYFVDSD
jgi:hypothetical protein